MYRELVGAFHQHLCREIDHGNKITYSILQLLHLKKKRWRESKYEWESEVPHSDLELFTHLTFFPTQTPMRL
jgi:hypothetical protein